MKIIAFTGAGISKQSNIPTFMERPDVRKSYLEAMHSEYEWCKTQMMRITPWQSIIFLLSQ